MTNNKVYAIFEKSNHPTGKLTEPIFICDTLEIAEKVANAAALRSIKHYTITEYDLIVSEDEIKCPKIVDIEAELIAEDKEVRMNIIHIIENPRIESIKKPFKYIVNKTDSNIITVNGAVEVINESYEDTIKYFKEEALKGLRNIKN